MWDYENGDGRDSQKIAAQVEDDGAVSEGMIVDGDYENGNGPDSQKIAAQSMTKSDTLGLKSAKRGRDDVSRR